LLAKTPCQPTYPRRHTQTSQAPACWRWRPANQPILADIRRPRRRRLAGDGGLPTNLSSPTYADLVGAGLLAKTACQPTCSRRHTLTSQAPACWRWRPANQPILADISRPCRSRLAGDGALPTNLSSPTYADLVGAGLLAKTPCQPTYPRRHTQTSQAPACWRWRPANQPILADIRRPRRRRLAGDGGLPTNLSSPTYADLVGAGLLAKTACQPTCSRRHTLTSQAPACWRRRPASQPVLAKIR